MGERDRAYMSIGLTAIAVGIAAKELAVSEEPRVDFKSDNGFVLFSRQLKSGLSAKL